MVVAVLTNGCRRFDHDCRRFGLSPCCLVAVLVVAVLDLSPFWLSPFRLVAVLTCILLYLLRCARAFRSREAYLSLMFKTLTGPPPKQRRHDRYLFKQMIQYHTGARHFMGIVLIRKISVRGTGIPWHGHGHAVSVQILMINL